MGQGTERRRLDSVQIQLRVPAAVTATLAAAVEAWGETMASWVRGQVLAALGVVDPEIALHRTTSPARRTPSDNILELTRFRRDAADLTLAPREACAAVGCGQQGASRRFRQLARGASRVIGDLDRLKAAMVIKEGGPP